MDSHEWTLSALPTELKLKISGYLDAKTLIFTLPLVNQEFQRLSQDFSLYRRYVSPAREIVALNNAQAKRELENRLFVENLRVLITTADVYDSIRHLRFPLLQKLMIKVTKFSKIQYGIIMDSTAEVILQGCIVHKGISQEVIPKLSFVEHLIVLSGKSIVKSIPAGKFLLNVGRNAFSMDDLLRISSGQSNLLPSTCEIGIVLSGNRMSLRDVLSPKYLDMLKDHLFSFTWHLLTHSREQNEQLLQFVCQQCVNLEEMTLMNVIMMPEIQNICCSKLQKLSLSGWSTPHQFSSPSGDISTSAGSLGVAPSTQRKRPASPDSKEQQLTAQLAEKTLFQRRCTALFNKVQKSICLQKMKLQGSISFNVRQLSLNKCSITHQFLIDLPDCVENLELTDILIVDITDSIRDRGFKVVKIEGYDAFCTLADTLNALGFYVTTLSLDLQRGYIAEQISELCELLINRSTNLDLYMTVRMLDLNSVLGALLGLRAQVRSLTIQVTPVTSDLCTCMSANSVQLLSHLDNLQYLLLTSPELYIDLLQLRKTFPSSTINTSRHPRLDCQTKLEIFF